MSRYPVPPRPRRTAAPALGAFLFAAFVAVPHVAPAQGFADRLRKKAENAAKRAVETRVERRAEQGARGAMDAAEQEARRAAGAAGAAAKRDTAAAAVTAPGATAPAATVPAAAVPNGAPAAASAAPPPAVRPGEGAWANYDFVPGARPLFADDFSAETVGNFPRRLEFKDGASEVVEWQGRRWLSSGNAGVFEIPLPEVLPERFTMEFDLAGSGNAMEVIFDGASTRYRKAPGVDHVRFGTWFAGVAGAGRDAAVATGYKTDREVVRARIMADGAYVKVFVNEKRVANVPNARLGRSNKIYVFLNGWSEKSPRMVGDVRVAAGGRALYDAIAEKGRAATQGVLFATASAEVRPESAPTLKEIAAMLAAHPGLRLTIEGHTDNAGDAAANQALSEARAAAVKQALVAGYGADAARLEARGFGASRPAAPNATAEGRQTNRRVELVRR